MLLVIILLDFSLFHSSFNINQINRCETMSHLKHLARPSMLGYLYQSRYALFLLLDNCLNGISCKIAIERLDDIDITDSNNCVSLYQLKHHITRQANLTDRSPDLWKTIREWSNYIKEGNSIDGINLLLVTTNPVPENSIAHDLQQKDRNNIKILEKLSSIAQKGVNSNNNSENTPSYSDFLSLEQYLCLKLVSAITILSDKPNMEEIDSNIKNKLGLTFRSQNLQKGFEALLGWWETKVVKLLIESESNLISTEEITLQLQDIRDQYNQIIPFPRHENDLIPEDSEYADPKKKYLQQLDLIEIGSKRKINAKNDFYRASSERSQWISDKLVHFDTIKNYDNRLKEEWKNRRDVINDDLSKNPTPEELVNKGKDLYKWVELEANIPVNPNCISFPRYLTKGSYHLLSDQLLIGWHPKYETIFGEEDNEDT